MKIFEIVPNYLPNNNLPNNNLIYSNYSNLSISKVKKQQVKKLDGCTNFRNFKYTFLAKYREDQSNTIKSSILCFKHNSFIVFWLQQQLDIKRYVLEVDPPFKTNLHLNWNLWDKRKFDQNHDLITSK